ARKTVHERSRQHAATGEDILRVDLLAGVRRDRPAAVLLAIVSRSDAAVELNVLLQVEMIRHEVEPAFGLGLRGKSFARLPGLVQLFGEPILIDLDLGVEARTRIAIPVPGA